MSGLPRDRPAYAASGVDVAAGDWAVELMRHAVEGTRRPEVLHGIGDFGAAVGVPAGYRDPVFVLSTDGVGTKTAIATALGRYDTIGQDLVAMCADDVVCSGAEPVWMLDYLAVGRVIPERVAEIVGGIAEGCRRAGCALVGGETAEHPGLMAADEFDVAGFCVGVVERERRLAPALVREGDALVGLAAAGLHANGFSLVRELVRTSDLDLTAPYAEVVRRWLPAADIEDEWAGLPLGEVLLQPTRIYAPAILELLRRVEVHRLAHVTGGGLPGNVPRMLPDGLGARLDPARWPMPTVLSLLGGVGGLDGGELRSTFNGGLGMVAALPRQEVTPAIEELEHRGIQAWEVGRVESLANLGGVRYVEAPIE